MLTLFINVFLKIFMIFTPFFVMSAFLSLTKDDSRAERQRILKARRRDNRAATKRAQAPGSYSDQGSSTIRTDKNPARYHPCAVCQISPGGILPRIPRPCRHVVIASRR